MSKDTLEVAELSPEQASELLEGGEAQLIDVRQPDEWEAGRIPGARHIPLQELPQRSEELDPSRPVIFQCRSGSRSALAAQAFKASGFDARNLGGGLERWVERGLPIEPEDGTVAGERKPDNS